jgi:dihydrofolate reductase
MTNESTPSPEIVLIAAVARNGVIGRGNELVFKHAEDQRHFRQATMGCPVIMGRKTWDSLPARFRPLPGRRNVVLSRDPHWQAEGTEAARNLDQALALVAGAPRVFVLGGAEIYALAMPRAHQLVLTEIDAELDGDVHFPAWDRASFEEISRSAPVESSALPFQFVTYRKRTKV